jgi:hypothetical protein
LELKESKLTGGWKKLYNELHNFQSLPTIIMAIKSAGLDLRGIN